MDESLFKAINRLADHTAWDHPIAKAYATYGIGLIAVLMLLAWWDARSADAPIAAVTGVVWSGIAPLISFVAGEIIGSAVNRARPTTAIPDTHLLLVQPRTSRSRATTPPLSGHRRRADPRRSLAPSTVV